MQIHFLVDIRLSAIFIKFAWILYPLLFFNAAESFATKNKVLLVFKSRSDTVLPRFGETIFIVLDFNYQWLYDFVNFLVEMDLPFFVTVTQLV